MFNYPPPPHEIHKVSVHFSALDFAHDRLNDVGLKIGDGKLQLFNNSFPRLSFNGSSLFGSAEHEIVVRIFIQP
jgi:hypothetical protein